MTPKINEFLEEFVRATIAIDEDVVENVKLDSIILTDSDLKRLHNQTLTSTWEVTIDKKLKLTAGDFFAIVTDKKCRFYYGKVISLNDKTMTFQITPYPTYNFNLYAFLIYLKYKVHIDYIPNITPLLTIHTDLLTLQRLSKKPIHKRVQGKLIVNDTSNMFLKMERGIAFLVGQLENACSTKETFSQVIYVLDGLSRLGLTSQFANSSSAEGCYFIEWRNNGAFLNVQFQPNGCIEWYFRAARGSQIKSFQTFEHTKQPEWINEVTIFSS